MRIRYTAMAAAETKTIKIHINLVGSIIKRFLIVVTFRRIYITLVGVPWLWRVGLLPVAFWGRLLLAASGGKAGRLLYGGGHEDRCRAGPTVHTVLPYGLA